METPGDWFWIYGLKNSSIDYVAIELKHVVFGFFYLISDIELDTMRKTCLIHSKQYMLHTDRYVTEKTDYFGLNNSSRVFGFPAAVAFPPKPSLLFYHSSQNDFT